MNFSQIRESVEQYQKNKGEMYGLIDYLLTGKKEFSPIKEFDPEVYAALWRLEQETGNPRIKFSTQGFESPRDHGRSHYSEVTNSVTLTLGNVSDMISDEIAELSHSKQINDAPLSSELKKERDFLKTLFRSFASGSTLDESYDRFTYKEPGSFENEAHEIIQPLLEKKFQEMTPTREAKKRKLGDK
jgi:hypothetical protein